MKSQLVSVFLFHRRSLRLRLCLQKHIKYLPFLVLTLIFLTPFFAIAKPHMPSLLPDEGSNFGCATCHISLGGTWPRNPFGNDWLEIAVPQGDEYVPDIANKDSDGDGFTNDEEFSAGTHPGDPESKPIVSLTITATAGEHGSIFPSGEVTLDHGTSQEFIITPDEGYRIEDVLVDGSLVPQVIEEITPDEAFALIQGNKDNPNFVILDVQTPEEFSSGHIENAINLDFRSETFTRLWHFMLQQQVSLV